MQLKYSIFNNFTYHILGDKMNIYLIEQYINKLTKEDINKFAVSRGIKISENDLNIIYNHLKKDYKTFIYGNQRVILDELKKEVEPGTYNQIELLFLQYKDKFN